MKNEQVFYINANELKTAFEGSMARIRKANDLPKTDLEGRYRKAYRRLLDEAAGQASRLKSAVVFSQLVISPEHEQNFKTQMDKYFREELNSAKIRQLDAIRRGDTKAVYEEIAELNRVVRRAAGYDSRPDAKI